MRLVKPMLLILVVMVIIAVLSLINVKTSSKITKKQYTHKSMKVQNLSKRFFLNRASRASSPSVTVSASTTTFSTSTIPPTTSSLPLPSITSTAPSTTVRKQTDNRSLGKQMMLEAGFGEEQWTCLEELWTRESDWNEHIANPYSGAAGIPQALPPSKMGQGWEGNPPHQINWGLNYIKNRYGTPCEADKFQKSNGWY